MTGLLEAAERREHVERSAVDVDLSGAEPLRLHVLPLQAVQEAGQFSADPFGGADCFGDVQILHAVVANDTTMLDFDAPPMDGTFLTAQTVRVVSEQAFATWIDEAKKKYARSETVPIAVAAAQRP